MKILGDIIAGLGIIAFILGACGYDSNTLLCGIVSLIGIVMIWIGYQMDKQTFQMGEDDDYIKRG